MKKILPMIGVMLLTASCGLIMSEESATEKTQDQAAATEFKVTEDVVDKPQDKPQEQLAVAETTEVMKSDPKSEEMRAPVEPRHEDFEHKPLAEVPTQSMAPQEFGSYKLGKDETLMMAAFKIYGDYGKWKELRAWNKEKLKKGLFKGVSIKYAVPEKKFVWEPSGLPYLVKTGNTLGTISKDKYGTANKWKVLYENNRPLIKNPNEIFAGFTIYYLPLRDIASEKK
jgi:nucleoid-associated protein YgaU